MEQKRQVLIAGLGLLGGSLGLALKGGPWRRLGWARRAETRALALKLDAVDETGDDLDALLARADLTVLALPVPVIETMFARCREHCRPGAVVTDIGSVRSGIERAAAVLAGSGVRFVGSHPMAGTEKSGLENAFARLYANADVFVIPPPGAEESAVALVESFWHGIGTHVSRIDAEAHDRLVAETSHVLHVVASALALSILGAADGSERKRRFEGCATGFRDTSRIASSSPAMWREIIESNRLPVLEALDGFAAELKTYRALIEAGAFDEFERRFAAGKELRDAWLAYKTDERRQK